MLCLCSLANASDFREKQFHSSAPLHESSFHIWGQYQKLVSAASKLLLHLSYLTESLWKTALHYSSGWYRERMCHGQHGLSETRQDGRAIPGGAGWESSTAGEWGQRLQPSWGGHWSHEGIWEDLRGKEQPEKQEAIKYLGLQGCGLGSRRAVCLVQRRKPVFRGGGTRQVSVKQALVSGRVYWI